MTIYRLVGQNKMPHSAEFTFKAFHFRNASEDAHKQIIQFPF